jgi:hypothetical protein
LSKNGPVLTDRAPATEPVPWQQIKTKLFGFGTLQPMIKNGLLPGGRQKGTHNRTTEEARAAAAATGILPLDYTLACHA